jgi:inner membrane protein
VPTILTHAVVAVALGAAASGRRRMPARFWLLAAGLAMLPDVDVLAWPLGLAHDPRWGHRGITHSLFAALAVAVLATLAAGPRIPMRRRTLGALLFVLMASHGVLDAFTNGGSGVAFLAPFDDTRYFFPWRPVEVSPIGLRVFSRWGLEVLESELLWIWLPAALIAAAGVRRRPSR